MTHSHHRMVASFAVVGLASSLVLGMSAASASADTQPTTPTVLTIPAGNRISERQVELDGVSDYGVVIREELDPADYNGTESNLILLGSDGTQTVVPGEGGGNQADTLFGDRVVAAGQTGIALSSVHSRVLPDGPLVTTTTPENSEPSGLTSSGILLNTADGLAIEPWDGGELIPITGTDAGLVVTHVLAADNEGVVVLVQSYAAAPTVSEIDYLDTATDTLWRLPDPNASNVALSASAIFWQSGEAEISSQARPAGSTGPGAVTTRPIPAADAGWGNTLLGVGNDAVIVSGVTGAGSSASSIHADGTATELGSDFIHLASDGSRLLAVRGLTNADETVQRVDAGDGSDSVLLSVSPVKSLAGEVGIDGDTIAVSGSDGLVRRQLDFGAGTVSHGDLLASDGRNPFVTGGDVYWTNSAEYRDLNNSSGTTQVGHGGYFDNNDLDAVGANWFYEGARRPGAGNPYLVNIQTGANKPAGFEAAMFDDVLYTPGQDVDGLAPGGVLEKDLDTGSVQYLAVSGCDIAEGVQAVESWLLVECRNGTYAVDQSGVTASWKLAASGGGLLGDGFVVAVDRTGGLSWTSLAGPVANWQPLGSIGQYAQEVSQATSLAVSSGPIPTVAWIDETGVAHAALLPGIPTTGLPAHPTGGPTAVPQTPTISATSADGSLTLNWSAPSSSDQVVNYDLKQDYHSIVLPAGTTSYTFTGLNDGHLDNYTLVAQNAFGPSGTAVIAAAAFDPNPSAPSALTAVFNQDQSELALAWSWMPGIGKSDLTGFAVTIPGYGTTEISAGARSTTIDDVRVPNGTTITLSVLSANGSASTTATSTVLAGPDLTPPTTDLAGPASVLLGTTLSATATGVDGRALGTVDVRFRDALSGHALGGWIYPASWQHVVSGSTVKRSGLARGATYCISMLARDAAGNESEWSRPVCTVVAADDRSMSRTSTWRRISGSGYLLHTATESSSTAGHLAIAARSKQLWIVARTCAACGDVGVRVNGHEYWVSLKSRTTVEQAIVRVPTTGTLSGTVSFVQRSAGKRVVIDGFAQLDY